MCVFCRLWYLFDCLRVFGCSEGFLQQHPTLHHPSSCTISFTLMRIQNPKRGVREFQPLLLSSDTLNASSPATTLPPARQRFADFTWFSTTTLFPTAILIGLALCVSRLRQNTGFIMQYIQKLLFALFLEETPECACVIFGVWSSETFIFLDPVIVSTARSFLNFSYAASNCAVQRLGDWLIRLIPRTSSPELRTQ